jgi:hypothetical protein
MTTRRGSIRARGAALAALLALLSAGGVARAQQPTAPDAGDAPRAPRPPEGERIINLPSAEVPAAGTLTMIFTHRFSQSLQDSDFHSLYSFDSGAEIGIGLGYVPFRNFEVSFYRSSKLDDYELDVKYRAVAQGPLTVALRLGGDWRSERFLDDRNGVFGQVVLGVSIGPRVRITAVPTYVSKTSQTPSVMPKPLYRNVFNVPVAVSVGLTRSINVQGELTARRGKYDSTGVGWVAAIEKTVPRHRFSFTVGNQRSTTVDQYVVWTPEFFGQSSHPFFIGFNIVRQWKL